MHRFDNFDTYKIRIYCQLAACSINPRHAHGLCRSTQYESATIIQLVTCMCQHRYQGPRERP